jgi:hypoxanthine phosphoribosyltransferase
VLSSNVWDRTCRASAGGGFVAAPTIDKVAGKKNLKFVSVAFYGQ